MNAIKVYSSVLDMTGQGEEWLISVNGDVLAVFIDGMQRCAVLQFPVSNNLEITRSVA